MNVTTESINDVPVENEKETKPKKMSKLKSKDMQFHVNGERFNRTILDLRNICERQNDFNFISCRPLSLPSINQSSNTSLGRRSKQKIFILTTYFAYVRARPHSELQIGFW